MNLNPHPSEKRRVRHPRVRTAAERNSGVRRKVCHSSDTVRFAYAGSLDLMREFRLLKIFLVAIFLASPAFAPQVAKILAPLEYLTVEQVGIALDRAAS